MAHPLRIFKKNFDVREALNADRDRGVSVGFVPTMGALHEGHLHLIRQAKESCERVLVSIFVNPRQFNNADDLNRYPRNLEGDIKKLEDCGCHYLFAPDEQEVYQDEVKHNWNFGEGQRVMEGLFRPGHFEGMLSVVHQLLNILQPHHLFMGEKDFQQAWLVQRLVSRFHTATRFHLINTVRESDGLAMSSRNRLLTPTERQIASALPNVLFSLSEKTVNVPKNERLQMAIEQLTNAGIRPEYLEIRNEVSLNTLDQWSSDGGRIFFAGFVGEIRLIDNVRVQ